MKIWKKSISGLTLGLLIASVVLAKKPEAPLAAAPAHLGRGPQLEQCAGLCTEPCEPAQPLPTNGTFGTDASCLRAWLELGSVTGQHTLRFDYYAPDGELYQTSTEGWTFPPALKPGRLLETVWIGHRFPVRDEAAALIPGAWKLIVRLDGVPLGELAFQLETPPVEVDGGFVEARMLYVDQRYGEAAIRFGEVAAGTSDPKLAAEAHWWQALSAQTAQDFKAVLPALRALLQANPAYAVSPTALEKPEGATLAGLLEEIRGESAAGPAPKSSFQPELKLGKDKAAAGKKRWPLWKKLVVYVGIPVVVGTVVYVLTKGKKDKDPTPTRVPTVPPATPTAVGTATFTPRQTSTPTRTGTATPTGPTRTPTQQVATNTPGPVNTATPVSTATPTQPAGNTPTPPPTSTPTIPAGDTPTPTATVPAGDTPTPTVPAGDTPTPTVPAGDTPTPTATLEPQSTFTPTATLPPLTETPTATSTLIPSERRR